VNYNPLLSSLIEIIDGYTRFDLNGRTLFFRHFSLRDQNYISINYEKYKDIAIKKGIETEQECLDRIKEDGIWNQSDDLKIAELELYVSNLKKSKNNLFLPSQKERHQKLIDDETYKLNILLAKKAELVGITAENYATKMSNEEFLRILIYEDKVLKKLAFTEDEFGSLPHEYLQIINKIYFNIVEKLNDENIQKIVVEDFFNMYISFCENSYAFFGKFICDLTGNQMKLLLYARVFNNIFQYNDDIPDHIKKDPKEIFEFIDNKKSKEKYENQVGDSDATMLFGATKKDIDILDPSAKKLSLSEEIAKNGGTLSMDQMIKLMGQ